MGFGREKTASFSQTTYVPLVHTTYEVTDDRKRSRRKDDRREGESQPSVSPTRTSINSHPPAILSYCDSAYRKLMTRPRATKLSAHDHRKCLRYPPRFIVSCLSYQFPLPPSSPRRPPYPRFVVVLSATDQASSWDLHPRDDTPVQSQPNNCASSYAPIVVPNLVFLTLPINCSNLW